MTKTTEIAQVFASVHEPQEMEKLLDEILSSRERHDLALRWTSMKRILQGVPQRKIAAELGISLCKITRGSRVLKDNQSVSKTILKKQLGEE